MITIGATSIYNEFSRLASQILEKVKVVFGRFTCFKMKSSESGEIPKKASHQPPKVTAPLQEKKAAIVQLTKVSASVQTKEPVLKKESAGLCKRAGNLLGKVAGSIFFTGVDATASVGKTLAYTGGYILGAAAGTVTSLPAAIPATMVDWCLNTDLSRWTVETGASIGGAVGGKTAHLLAQGTCLLVKGGFKVGTGIVKGSYKLACGRPDHNATHLESRLGKTPMLTTQ